MANVDHVQSFLDRISRIAWLVNAEVFKDLARPILDDMNTIEAVVLTVSLWANLPGATGQLLARIGQAVGLENPGGQLTDDVFRAFVQAAIYTNLSGAIRDLPIEQSRAIRQVAEAMQVRAFADPVQIGTAIPFQIAVVIPGLLGVEFDLARQLLLRAIGATDGLLLAGPPEGTDLFTWNGTPDQGWNSGVWANFI